MDQGHQSHGTIPPSMSEDAYVTGDEDTFASAESESIEDMIDRGVCPFCPEDEVIQTVDGVERVEGLSEEERTFGNVYSHMAQMHEEEYEAWKAQNEDEDDE